MTNVSKLSITSEVEIREKVFCWTRPCCIVVKISIQLEIKLMRENFIQVMKMLKRVSQPRFCFVF